MLTNIGFGLVNVEEAKAHTFWLLDGTYAYLRFFLDIKPSHFRFVYMILQKAQRLPRL
jgi:hypothetical protein